MMDAGSHDQFIENHGKSVWTWGSKHFDKILNIYLDQNWISTFATGLNIFLPVSFYLITEPIVYIPVLMILSMDIVLYTYFVIVGVSIASFL